MGRHYCDECGIEITVGAGEESSCGNANCPATMQAKETFFAVDAAIRTNPIAAIVHPVILVPCAGLWVPTLSNADMIITKRIS